MPATVVVLTLNGRQIAESDRQPETTQDQPCRIIGKVLFEAIMKAIIVTIITTTIMIKIADETDTKQKFLAN